MRTVLRVAGIAKVLTLAIMLGNLATVRLDPVGSVLGPVHGILYLVVVVLSLLQPIPVGKRLLGLVPGIGGLLVLRASRDRAPDETPPGTYW
ncbi:hypothetical protein [Compostimonas suwonensis]|uniref:Uncharacterized protein n=1 Tax=Compostimonas suwonensis TaxID=1048394 RepID=A0A2M9BVS4_9MICO|nr:hypothetical protein [Compostimonas suwonensis]PJJ62014.1 hypothetical protein CLV54_1806 [Compostimonas suwonensis]